MSTLDLPKLSNYLLFLEKDDAEKFTKERIEKQESLYIDLNFDKTYYSECLKIVNEKLKGNEFSEMQSLNLCIEGMKQITKDDYAVIVETFIIPFPEIQTFQLEIGIENSFNNGGSLFNSLKQIKQLKIFKLFIGASNNFSENEAQLLSSSLQELNLVDLRIDIEEDNPLKILSGEYIGKSIQKMENLKNLGMKIYQNKEACIRYIFSLGQSLSQIEHLENLDLIIENSNQINDLSLVPVGEQKKEKDSQTDGLLSQALEIFSSSLKRHTQLYTLYIKLGEKIQVSERAAQALGESHQNHSKLTELQFEFLGSNKFDNENLIHWSYGIRKLKQLKYLKIAFGNSNKLTGKGFDFFSKALANAEELVQLNLSFGNESKFEELGCDSILKGISMMQNLEILYMQNFCDLDLTKEFYEKFFENLKQIQKVQLKISQDQKLNINTMFTLISQILSRDTLKQCDILIGNVLEFAYNQSKSLMDIQLMEGCEISKISSNLFEDMQLSPTNIRIFSDYNSGLTLDCLENIYNLLSKLKNISIIQLFIKNFDCMDNIQILEFLQKTITLEKINLFEADLGCIAKIAILKKIYKKKQRQEYRLYTQLFNYSDIKDEGVNSFCQIIDFFQDSLSVLKFDFQSGCEVTKDGFEQFFSQVAKMIYLRKIDFKYLNDVNLNLVQQFNSCNLQISRIIQMRQDLVRSVFPLSISKILKINPQMKKHMKDIFQIIEFCKLGNNNVDVNPNNVNINRHRNMRGGLAQANNPLNFYRERFFNPQDLNQPESDQED